MTVYAWPDFPHRAFELRVLANTRSFVGPYTPTVQVLDLLGERWQGRIDLALTENPLEGGAREAFFDRLRGGANQFSLYNLRRPVPLGTARGNITLGAAAAQLANVVTLTGVTSSNLLLGGGFDYDTDGNGVSDYWTVAQGGPTTGTVTADRPLVSGRGYVQRLSVTALGSAGTDFVRIFSPQVAVTAGAPYSLSADVSSSTPGHQAYGILVWLGAGSTYISETANPGLALTTGWQTLSVSGIAPVGAQTCVVIIQQAAGGGASRVLSIDAAMLSPTVGPAGFAGPATLVAGDMLGINGQLVRVMADSTFQDNGWGSVEFQPRLRAAASAGAAVQWLRPMMNVMLKGDVATTWQPGYAEGCSFEFIEVP